MDLPIFTVKSFYFNMHFEIFIIKCWKCFYFRRDEFKSKEGELNVTAATDYLLYWMDPVLTVT